MLDRNHPENLGLRPVYDGVRKPMKVDAPSTGGARRAEGREVGDQVERCLDIENEALS